MPPRPSLPAYRLALPLLLGTLAASCATGSKTPLPMGEQIERIFSLSHWQMKGRFSTQVDGENVRGSLRLKHYPNTYSMSLSGPFGVGNVQLRGYWEQNVVHVKQGRKEDVVLLEELGLPPPHALRRWLLGRPTSAGHNVEQDYAGRNLSFDDEGWSVRYLEYTLVQGIWMPVRIRAKGPETSALIGIKSWKLK